MSKEPRFKPLIINTDEGIWNKMAQPKASTIGVVCGLQTIEVELNGITIVQIRGKKLVVTPELKGYK